MDPCWSMDLDFQRSRGAPPRRSANNTGSSTIPASQRSFLPVAQRSPSKYHPSPPWIPVGRWTLISNDPGGATTAESQQHRFFNDPRFPTIPFYRLRNDPRQNTIPVLNGSLLSMDRDFQRSRGGHHGGGPTIPGGPARWSPNNTGSSTIPASQRSFLPVAQRSPSKYHPSPRWIPVGRWTWISNDPGGATTAECQQHRFFNDPRFPTILFYRLRNDPRQNTIPVLNGSLLLVDLDSQRSRGAPHDEVPTTPVLQRSPLPNDLFYRLCNDPRQNTIPVIKRSLLLMDLDSQRSRGAQHRGVPTTPVFERSPLPNDPFYRLRNDPRQNTIPVHQWIPFVDGPGFPTIPGGPPRRRHDDHRGASARSPLPNDLFYRFFNGPRQNTIPVIKRSLLLVDLDCATIPGCPPRRSTYHHRSFNDPLMSHGSLLPDFATIPGGIPSQSSSDPCC